MRLDYKVSKNAPPCPICGLTTGCIHPLESLTDKLRERLAFDYSNSRIEYQRHEWPQNETILPHSIWTEGQRVENARFESIIKALLAVAEAAEYHEQHDDLRNALERLRKVCDE